MVSFIILAGKLTECCGLSNLNSLPNNILVCCSLNIIITNKRNGVQGSLLPWSAETRVTCGIFIGKPEQYRPLGRLMCRAEDVMFLGSYRMKNSYASELQALGVFLFKHRIFIY